jgi:hypothetical protein
MVQLEKRKPRHVRGAPRTAAALVTYFQGGARATVRTLCQTSAAWILVGVKRDFLLAIRYVGNTGYIFSDRKALPSQSYFPRMRLSPCPSQCGAPLRLVCSRALGHRLTALVVTPRATLRKLQWDFSGGFNGPAFRRKPRRTRRRARCRSGKYHGREPRSDRKD